MGNYYPAELRVKGISEHTKKILYLVWVVDGAEKTSMKFLDKLGFGTGKFNKMKIDKSGTNGKMIETDVSLDCLKPPSNYVMYDGQLPGEEGASKCQDSIVLINLNPLSITKKQIEEFGKMGHPDGIAKKPVAGRKIYQNKIKPPNYHPPKKKEKPKKKDKPKNKKKKAKDKKKPKGKKSKKKDSPKKNKKKGNKPKKKTKSPK